MTPNGYAPVMRDIEWEPVPFGMGPSPASVGVRGELRGHHPFSIDGKWRALIERISKVPGVRNATDAGMYPWVPLDAIADDETWREFFAVVEWIMKEIHHSARLNLS